MRDTTSSRNYLKQALTTLPNDNALQEVNYYIRQAIVKLEQVEKKRQKREQVKTPHQTWHEMLRDGIQNPSPNISKRTLDIIEQMIAQQKKILEDIEKKKTTQDNKPDENLLG